ncbi:uncharacterized protein N7483_007467 [Penicillium malachiteum]|uniref:uncharacterized protein n=1 Tax=Penicillium malachiteum TaxID=1324776 RepID=UPI002546F328|nr:uncharacterized protein N7483_007467 [Penicillium malachiteum]KAJ5726110.1 hypothetical protein N7483_007467 [Penicillium malachiteum]
MDDNRRVRCTYKTNAGVIQLDVRNLSGTSSRRLFTDQRPPNEKIPRRSAFIDCALHPVLTNQNEKNDLLSQSIQKAMLWKKRCWDEVHQITENDRFCLDRVFVNIHLPYIYLGCFIVPPAEEKIIDLATAAAHRDFQVLDSVITLLQNHFPFCKCIHLVIKTITDQTVEVIPSLAGFENVRNPYFWDDKALTRVVELLEGRVLQRVDELYRSMIQQQPQLLKAEYMREGLWFLPSLWEPFEKAARSRNAIIRDGGVERSEIAVWRPVDNLDTTEIKREGDAGYYVATHMLDVYEWGGMEFV